jgi:hypothetical protein
MEEHTPEKHQLMHQLESLAPHYPEIRERLAGYFAKWDEIAVKLISHGVEDGHFRPVNAHHVAQAIIGLYDGLHMRKQLDPSIDVLAVIETVSKLIYDAIATPECKAHHPEE